MVNIRKLVVSVEEPRSVGGKPVDSPARKAIAAAVIDNPYAGQFVDDLEPLYDLGAEIGGLLAERGVQALGVEPERIDAYGKGAVIGVDGELEHAAALLHPRFGAPVRAAVGGGKDIIPSTKKVGGPGSTLVMPITNKDSIWQFDDMDAAEITVPDAPRGNEILVAVVLAIGGRPLARTRPDS